jgi:hypothetical protein
VTEHRFFSALAVRIVDLVSLFSALANRSARYAEKREPVLTSGATFDQLLAQTVYNEIQRLALDQLFLLE